MRRARSQSIGGLGRAPARQPSAPPVIEPPDRGAIRRWVHGALFENVGLKFLSMILAITVFLLVNTDRDRVIQVRLGVNYSLPDDKVLTSSRQTEVRVTIKGPWQQLRHFDTRAIDRINLDLRRGQQGDIAITPDMIDLPPGLSISSISPSTIRVTFERRSERIVEVAPKFAGFPLHGYYVSEIKATPATIKVRGAESTLAALSSLETRDVSVDGRAESFTAEAELELPQNVESVNPSVMVSITIDEELVTRKLPGVTIGVVGEGVDPTRWQLTPPQIDITLVGSLLAVEKAKALLKPVVKQGAYDTRAREAAVSVEGLPPGVGVKISPERVKISPVRPTP